MKKFDYDLSIVLLAMASVSDNFLVNISISDMIKIMSGTKAASRYVIDAVYHHAKEQMNRDDVHVFTKDMLALVICKYRTKYVVKK